MCRGLFDTEPGLQPGYMLLVMYTHIHPALDRDVQPTAAEQLSRRLTFIPCGE